MEKLTKKSFGLSYIFMWIGWLFILAIPFIPALLAPLLTGGIILLIPRFIHNRAYKNDNNFEDYVKGFGNPQYFWCKNYNGIAITAGGDIALYKLDNMKVYQPNQIREWKSSIYEQGIISGGGLTGLALVAQESAKAKARTGLYLSVKDVEFPTWHIMIQDKSMLEKWHEILNQTIND
jgi:hypothetical protein